MTAARKQDTAPGVAVPAASPPGERPAWLAGRVYRDGPHGREIAGPAQGDRKAGSGEDDRAKAPGEREQAAKAAPRGGK